MKTVKRQAPQGDVLFMRVRSIPKGLTEVARESDGLVVAHSETGHHHAIPSAGVAMFRATDDQLKAYLDIAADFADVVHLRPYDTHETLRLGHGKWEVRRQREHTPEGWRRVED